MTKKKLFAFVLALAVLAGLAGTAFASEEWVTQQLFYGDIKIKLNGSQITPTDANGKVVEPFIIDGTTYLPVRAVSGALGLDVGWDGTTRTVSLTGAAAGGASPSSLFDRCKGSVVHIETNSGGGTGFFIEENIIVTNNHVIKGAFAATAKTADGRVMKVTHIVARSENPDLALLKVDGKGTPVQIASTVANVGADVYSIGAPLGIFPTFSSGMVQHNSYTENGTNFYLTNIGTISGNSGGPVFNAAGEVIAVVQGGMTDGSNTIDMMIRIDHVKNMDRSHPQELTGKEPLPEDGMVKASSLATAKVGELVSFGRYEQDNNSSTKNEAIWWIVVEKNGSELKLMSLYALDVVPFMTSNDPVRWESSNARAFLNGEFYSKAFNASEQARILSVNVTNTANPVHGTSSGANTTDKVYLPNLEEIVDYYGINGYNEGFYDGVFAHATPYAVSKNVWLEIPGSTKCWWWLRSSGGSDGNAAEVGSAGYISFNGADADTNARGLRPVIHVKVN